MLSRKLKGHYGYYGIRGNARALHSFHRQVWFIWLRALRRRSQTAKVSRLVRPLNGRFPLSSARITHPDNWPPGSAGDLLTCLEEPDAVTPHVRFCEGERQQRRSYSTAARRSACHSESRVDRTPIRLSYFQPRVLHANAPMAHARAKNTSDNS